MKCVKHLLGALLAFCILVLPNIARAQWSQGDYFVRDGIVIIDDQYFFRYPLANSGNDMFNLDSALFSTSVPHAEAHSLVGKGYAHATYGRTLTWSPAGTLSGPLNIHVTADGSVNGQVNGLAWSHTQFGNISLIGGVRTEHFQSPPGPGGASGSSSPQGLSFDLWAEADGHTADASADETAGL